MQGLFVQVTFQSHLYPYMWDATIYHVRDYKTVISAQSLDLNVSNAYLYT